MLVVFAREGLSVKHVLQPLGSRLCGQACLAMLLGITLADAVDRIGHRKATKTKELLRVLREEGYEPEGRLKWKKAGPPKTGTLLLSIRRPPLNWKHWAVMEDGVIYDPVYGVGPYPLAFWEENVRATSFLQVK